MRPAGRNPEKAQTRPPGPHSDALFVRECQSFLDNLMARFRVHRSPTDRVRPRLLNDVALWKRTRHHRRRYDHGTAFGARRNDRCRRPGLAEAHAGRAPRGQWFFNAVRQEIEDCGGKAFIPSTASRKIQRTVDKAIYALRNRIERFFNHLKNSRRVATRYDKLIESFAAFVIVATIRIWIRFVHTT
jgi:transposase